MADAEVTAMSHAHVISEEFPDEERAWLTPWTFAVVIAISMVLPAIGMIVGGFADGSFSVGFFGLGLLIATAIGYYVVLWKLVLSHLG